MNLSKQKCKEICDIINRLDRYFTEIKKDLPKIVTLLKSNKQQTKKQSKFDTKSKSGSVKPKQKNDKKLERFSNDQSVSEDFKFDKDDYTRKESDDFDRELSNAQNLIIKRKEINLYEKEKSVKGKKTNAKVNKPKKDENAPKPPLSAFFLFMRQKRDDVKKEFPNLTSTEFARLMGKLWSNLTTVQKKPYQDIAILSHSNYKSYLSKQLNSNRSSLKSQ